MCNFNLQAMSKAKKKYYVVWRGVKPGIYEDWPTCQAQVKGYPNASFKAFSTREEAEKALEEGLEVVTNSEKDKKKAKASGDSVQQSLWREREVDPQAWAVDAACSGNPGPMEYRGVYVADGTELFHQSFPLGTNNVGEFLAIVHALALAEKTGKKDVPIYSDSSLAIGWVKKGRCKTTLLRNEETKTVFELIARAEKWLAEHAWSNPLLKWDTARWGEIPADFGRKKSY